ncbi:hypothetical protein [Streptomyces althioticus]|uniref:hypothetical protein n=1 Tax=Streptomyces althioticus TaxID=83380 RepID=UPI0033AAE60F
MASEQMVLNEKPLGAFIDVLAANPRPPQGAPQGERIAYATRFANDMATFIANQLRGEFDGILPTPDGKGQESRARTAKGFKRLDVNYSTPQLGLGLGVSLKHIQAADGKSSRYTKNYSRNDAELRAEAMDYHQRQPYAVLIGLLLLPYDACDDYKGGHDPSSFGAAVRTFRNRAGRARPDGPLDLFEKFFIGLYEHEGPEMGRLDFYDVERPAPPAKRRPAEDEFLTLDGFVGSVVRAYDARNNPPMVWADM